MHKGAITITANASTGLFYGVETFVQLLGRNMGTFWFPEGSIVDWPDDDIMKRAKQKDPKQALSEVDSALDIATSIWQQRNEVLKNSVATWDERWFPRIEEANGRRFLHELDDVKDHLPDRTIDMSYLAYREELLPFGEWVSGIATARNRFASAHHLPVRKYRLAWENLNAVPTVCSSASSLLANPQSRLADLDREATCGMGD
jgi:hypothetical protein